MKWTINYSREAEKFIEREDIRGDVREELTKFLKKMFTPLAPLNVFVFFI